MHVGVAVNYTPCYLSQIIQFCQNNGIIDYVLYKKLFISKKYLSDIIKQTVMVQN